MKQTPIPIKNLLITLNFGSLCESVWDSGKGKTSGVFAVFRVSNGSAIAKTKESLFDVKEIVV